MNEAIDEFLREKCNGIRHTGRGFYSHLRGTYELLRDMHAPNYVCLGGLFHSIYGTNVFKIAAVAITTRKEVKDLIGEDAERLAHVFCTTNRPTAFIHAARNGPPYRVENRVTHELITLSQRELYDLLTIEIANLREQRAYQRVPEVRRAWQAMGDMLDAA